MKQALIQASKIADYIINWSDHFNYISIEANDNETFIRIDWVVLVTVLTDGTKAKMGNREYDLLENAEDRLPPLYLHLRDHLDVTYSDI